MRRQVYVVAEQPGMWLTPLMRQLWNWDIDSPIVNVNTFGSNQELFEKDLSREVFLVFIRDTSSRMINIAQQLAQMRAYQIVFAPWFSLFSVAEKVNRFGVGETIEENQRFDVLEQKLTAAFSFIDGCSRQSIIREASQVVEKAEFIAQLLRV